MTWTVGLSEPRGEPHYPPGNLVRLAPGEWRGATDTLLSNPLTFSCPPTRALRLARLHAAHPEPVGSLVLFERPEALLSLIEPDDVFFTARVELSGVETMGHLHELIHTVTRGVTGELGYAGPRGRFGGPGRQAA